MNGFDQSTETQRPPWKIVALVAGAAVLAVGLIVGAVLFVRSRQKVEIATQNMDRVEAQLASSLAGCAEQPDPDECRRNKILLAAQATGAVSVCDGLEGEDRDSCVWTIAKDREDPKACSSIVDQDRATACSDQINTRLAIATKDPAYCKWILDETRLDGCMNSVIGPLSASNCAERGQDQVVCDNLEKYEAVIKAKDPSGCATLSVDDDRIMCLELIGTDHRGTVGLEPIDSDGDGLSDAAEKDTYQTDPSMADTDGDGYSDKVEIDGGYNPNGDGKLPS